MSGLGRRAPAGRLLRRALLLLVSGTLGFLAATPAGAQAPVRKIGQLKLSLLGLSATVDPAEPVVPKNTGSAVRIVVQAGGQELSVADVARFVGLGFRVEGELSGPGLAQTITLPRPSPDPVPSDPLLLPLPPLNVAGDYSLTNLRIVVDGRPALDVTPDRVPLKVIDQILVTSVKTRPLTLDEIKAKGIVLDRDDYVGFEFTMGLKLDSKVVNLNFPVVFDRQGLVVPQPVALPTKDPTRVTPPAPQLPGGAGMIVPLMLAADEGGGGPKIDLTLPNGQPVRIPSVLVIPGNVGYLKQFFSAQLFVANGAPAGSGLVVRDITGTIKLPPGADLEPGTADDPLALPELQRDGQTIVQPTTMAVRGVGPDGLPGTADDLSALDPAEQAQAEFLIRGEKEGFHQIDFDIHAVLEGLPVGPVGVTGKATGGVLVRNAFFDVTFTVPSVVRKGERFKLFATINNIGKGDGNLVHMSLDSSRMSGVRLIGDGTKTVDTIRAGDARTLDFEFESLKTGQVTAAYLRFDAEDAPGGVTGDLKFTLGVGERGVPLSPDTLVLPTAVDLLPSSVVEAAMRVLGQAWSIANAAPNTLPRGVVKTTRAVVTEKALALAEAGLRVTLGEPVRDALRELALDFYGGSPVDPGFDQLLRQTDAGRSLALAFGAELAAAAVEAGGATAYERELARLAASGPDFISFAATGGSVELSLSDGLGRTSVSGRGAGGVPASQVPSAVVLPLGDLASAPLLGLVTAPSASPYTLEVSGPAQLSVTLPRGDGTFLRGTGASSARAQVVIDLARPDALVLREDRDGDGVFETPQPLATEVLVPEGAHLVSATVIGPETFDRASEFGLNAVLLFDRVVEAVSGSTTGNYQVPANSLAAVKPQLSGRLVFATLVQPEGPYVPTTMTVSGVADLRGVVAPPLEVPLRSRLAEAGAVVSGRVVDADGVPLGGGTLIYLNQSNAGCEFGNSAFAPLSALTLGPEGRYEIRYVHQNQCGLPFKVSIQDPVTTNYREAVATVHRAGEQILLDIALIGRGSVTGTVRDLGGGPVPRALVAATSATDPNRGLNAQTDGDGRYRMDGLTVGQISVKAGKGVALGRSTGRIDRAGTTAVIDVTLDGGAVSVSGRYLKVEAGVPTPISGALLAYTVGGQAAGYVFTTAGGSYAFDAMPVGHFRISAVQGPGAVEGDASAGDVLSGRDIVYEVQPPEVLGTVRGFVVLPDGSPAAGAIVARDVSGPFIDGGVVTGAGGEFELSGLPVGSSFTLSATTRDRLRSGSASLTIDPTSRLAEDIVISLSGVGTVEFTVLDALGRPVANQEVALLGGCRNPCGCRSVTTTADGRARFEGLRLGAVYAQAVRQATGYTDVAQAGASVTRDGATAFAVLRFPGAGVVTGVVDPPPGVTLTGGEVALSSMVFKNDGVTQCGLAFDESHHAQIDPVTHRFRFTSVHVGPVSVTASNPFTSANVGASGTLTTNGQELEFHLQFVDTTAGELSGTVFLPDGTTPAGAGVEVTANGALPDVTVSTDAEGHFHFAKIFPQGSYTLIARDPVTGGVAREFIFLQAGQSITHDLRLKGRGTVGVRVVDGADHAVSSAFVRVRETDFPNRTYEGAVQPSSQGAATFESVFEGPFSVEVSDALGRGGRGSGVLPKPGDTVDIKIRLTVTGSVRGRFLLPDHTTPIPFGVIQLIAGGRVIGQQTTAGAGDVGAFSFDYVPAGPVRVEAQDPLTLRTGFAVGTIEAQDQVLNVDVVAQGLGRVQGLVTSRRSGVVDVERGAHVDIVSGSFRACTLTDSTGHYLIEGVPEGQVVVTASLPGGAFSGTASATLHGDGETLTIDVALRDSGTVRGQVFEAGGVVPASISTVTIEVGGAGGGRQSAVTDADGRFVFDRVPAGHAVLSVDKLSSIDRARTEFEVPAGVVDVQATLNGVGTIHGRTLGSDGQPVAGALTIEGTGPFRYTFYLDVGTNGTFTLPEVLAGPFTASLRSQAQFTLYGTAAGAVSPGDTTELDVQIQSSGTVTGLVLRSDGERPAYGTDVTVNLEPCCRGSVTLQAGTDGRFTARGVPLGAFSLRLHDPVTAGEGLLQGRSLDDNSQVLDVGSIVLDDTPVSLVSVDPASGSTGVAVSRTIQAVFSDPLYYTYGVSIRNAAGGAVGFYADLSPDRKTLSLAPAGSWPDSQDLTIDVGTGVTDVFLRHLQAPVSSSFHTVDLSPPRVVAIVPASGAIQVPPDATVAVTFSEPLSDTTNLAALVYLSGPAGTVPGTTVLGSSTTATFTPGAPLAANGVYSVSVNGAVDLSGNTQTVAFSSTFKTVDTVPPVLSLSSPAPGAWVRTTRPTVTVSLSDALSGIDTPASTLALDGAAVAPVRSPYSVSFTPSADLVQGIHPVAASAKDLAGNEGSLPASSFGVDTVAPAPAEVTGVAEGQTVRGTISLGGSATDETSGVAKVEILSDGGLILTLTAPSFAGSYNTAALSEGPHALTARATDVAGNVGIAGPPVHVVVDNLVLTLAITSPPANSRFRDSVLVKAATSEPVNRVEFSVGSQTVVDTTAPYEATLDLRAAAEGTVTVTVTAFGNSGDVATATQPIVVDRTPPAAPDAGKITAQESDAGYASVAGVSGAVEGGATVEVTNDSTGAMVTDLAAGDGSFATRLLATVDTVLSIVAIDSVGNRGAATTVTVAPKPTRGGVPLAGLQMWISADGDVTKDESGLVSAVTDQSDLHNDLVQSTVSAQPVLVPNGFNGYPVLRFDGNSDHLRFTTRLANIRTVFWVIREDEAATNDYRFLLHDCCTYDFHGGAPQLWLAGYTSGSITNGQTWLNGAPIDGTATSRPRTMSVLSAVTTGPVSADRFGSGNTAGRYWWGDLAELIIYDRPLSSADRQAVEDYLVRKYRPYVPSVGTPSILPSGGTFSGSTTVTLATTTPDASLYYTLDGSEPSTSSLPYTAPFLVTATTTIKAKGFRDGYNPSATATITLVESGESVPTAGLMLWLRADAGVPSEYVDFWADQSGQDNHATQLSGTAIPRVVPNAVNGLPALHFDGNDVINFKARLTTIRTVFWVIREDAAATNDYRFLLHDCCTYDFHGGVPQLWLTGYTSAGITNGQTWLNGAPIDGTTTSRPRTMSVLSVVTTGPVTADRFGSGNTPGRYWWGDLAELIIYDRPLSVTERKEVEDYLLVKYQLGGTVTAPNISPNGGVFTDPVTVTLSTPTPAAEIFYTTDGTEPTTASTLYSGPLEITSSTTLKVKAFRDGLPESNTVTAGFTNSADFNPKSLTGLQLWLRADAGVPSGFGDLWADQSGNGNDGSQLFGTAIPRVVPNAVNGLPALHFDGNDVVNFKTRLTTIRTVFWVIREDTAATNDYRFLLHDCCTYDFHGGVPQLWLAGYTSGSITNGQTWLNGTPIDGTATSRPRTMSVLSVVTTGPVSADRFGSGNTSGRYWWGDLAELIIYDRSLSMTDRKAIEDYLLNKYRLGVAVTAPRISPDGGVFTDSVTVSVTTPTPGATIFYTRDGTEPTTSSSLYTGPLTVTSTVTLKAKAFVTGFGESVTVTAGFTNGAEFNPKSLTGLQLWLRADAGTPTGYGDLWADQSGNGNNASQIFGTAIPRVVPNAVNGLPALHFDGNDVVNFKTRLTSIRTVFWVIREDSAATNDYRFLLHDCCTYDFHGGAPQLWLAGYTSSSIVNGQTTTWLNGAPIDGTVTSRPKAMSILSLVTTGPVTADRFGSGNTTGRYWWGDLAELILYDGPLSDTDRRRVEDYLNARYGIFHR